MRRTGTLNRALCMNKSACLPGARAFNDQGRAHARALSPVRTQILRPACRSFSMHAGTPCAMDQQGVVMQLLRPSDRASLPLSTV